MSWAFGIQDFSSLKEFICRDGITLEHALVHPQLRVAFKRQFTPLIKFLLANLCKLFDVAMMDMTDDNKMIISNAIYCLSTPAVSFTNHLPSHRDFLQKLSDFLQSPDFNLTRATTFSIIFDSAISFTTGYILVTFPNKDTLTQRMMAHIKMPPIYNSISNLLVSLYSPIIKFLADNNVMQNIFDSLGEDDEVNSLIFDLFIECSKSNIAIISPIATTENIQKIHEHVFTSSSHEVGSKGIILIMDICNCMKSTRNTNANFKESIDLLISKVDDMCDYIKSGDDYTIVKSHVADLIIYLIPHIRSFTQPLKDLPIHFFNILFQYPLNSIEHHQFIVLFKLLLNQIKPEDMKQITDRIPIAFDQYRKINATYWYHLFQVTQLIKHTHKEPKNDEKWNKYVSTMFADLTERSKQGYGGRLPQVQEPSDYYDYEEEDM
ncbi:hypothetical protein GPJ56_000993 [Histomonas meleagridis]|uniref:uncharacterized protein n=1 Tax=Histomonas meleagridis TaxID=135588 RepID=UPI00355939F9|nr:hypothetical protein GPJ56_000993 [Histomonas meleagridis]KAH0803830.1 hypothetical protein GO595_002660 [Histomonas meleagridis]